MAQRVTNFYTINWEDTLTEGGSIELSAFIGLGIAYPVTMTLTVPDGYLFQDGTNTTSLQFDIDELGSAEYLKTVTLSVLDDLVIDPTRGLEVAVAFTSDDAGIDGLTESLSVLIQDNDFQRSVDSDREKQPSDGNNKIIYDLSLIHI